MKIAWFTPFSKKSAVGRFSQGVVAELSKNAEVDICHFDNKDVRDTSLSLRKFASADAVSDAILSKYDLAIYNFGNHLPYHREIYSISRRWPGLCILHDFVMHHFFAAYYLEALNNRAAYCLLMEKLYGPEGRAASERNVWESKEVSRFPLFEEVVQGAVGVVTHSGFFAKRAQECFSGPAQLIRLPFAIDRDTPVAPRSELDIRDDQVLIVTVGHVNPNKRIPAAIEALGRLGPLAHDVVYAILGPCSPAYQAVVEESIHRSGLGGAVRLMGYVSDEVVRAYLSHADLCMNLRFPPTEGASGSVLEEMLFGNAVIVNDVGFFSELPDDCVVKVHPEQDSDLTSALRKLIADRDTRRALGARAREYVEQECGFDRYAKELLDFAWDVRSARPLLGLADRLALECNRMGITHDSGMVDTLARELQSTFCEHRTHPPLWRE